MNMLSTFLHQSGLILKACFFLCAHDSVGVLDRSQWLSGIVLSATSLIVAQIEVNAVLFIASKDFIEESCPCLAPMIQVPL